MAISISMKHPERALVSAAKSDPDAFAALYERTMPNVYRYILSRVGNVQDAEDLTTQTYMAALDGLHNYRGQGAFLTWVIGIARRKVADFFRGHRNVLPLENAPDLRDTALSPEAATEQSLQMDRVAATLTIIAPDRAEAITLKIFGGLSTAEVATLMNRSEDAVHALVSRGMRDLRQRLNEED